MKVNETCSCGARFQASGFGASAEARMWRVMHSCKTKEAPWSWSDPDQATGIHPSGAPRTKETA